MSFEFWTTIAQKKHDKFKDTEQKLLSIKQHKNGQPVKFAWKSCESCQKPASQNWEMGSKPNYKNLPILLIPRKLHFRIALVIFLRQLLGFMFRSMYIRLGNNKLWAYLNIIFEPISIIIGLFQFFILNEILSAIYWCSRCCDFHHDLVKWDISFVAPSWPVKLIRTSMAMHKSACEIFFFAADWID